MSKNLTNAKVWSFLRSWLGPGRTQSLRRPTRIPPSGQIIHHNFTNSFKNSSNNHVTLSYIFFSNLKPWITAFNHLENLKDSHIWHSCFDEKKVMLFSFFFLGHFPAYRLDQHNNLTRFFLTTDTVRCLYFKKATKNLWNRRNDWMVEFGL